MQKPGIPEGTRDFGPEQVRKRTFIFDTIRAVFVKFGFEPLETPAMENLSTLTGKYGEEGDKLLFKILNNGDFMKDVSADDLTARNSNRLVSQLSKRGLRYDLTVPFARYVVMNRHALTLPFKRFQIQPVWRADRPQRGRYREFFQCDVDVIGSDSLLYEAELVQIYDEAFARLGVPVTIKINNRKVLYGIAEAAGVADRFIDMTVAVDKLDKIGLDGVKKELSERGIDAAATEIIVQTLAIMQQEHISNAFILNALKDVFVKSETGQKGVAELEAVFAFLADSPLQNQLQIDLTLARGLSYYTGCIYEVAAIGVKMGSIGGGGRYDDLTGVFGMPGLSGVGVSFGADRIYDVMDELNVFPTEINQTVQVLFASMDAPAQQYAFRCATQLRAAGIPVEIYPEPGKLKKQFEYVAKKGIPYMAIIGDTEVAEGTMTIKNQVTKEELKLTVDAFIALLKG